MSTPQLVISLRRRLLNWFAKNARSLPWRQTRDPYAIWISEVMLQQTQVVTVIPYFQRFLTSFPSIAALARSDLQEVLKHWEGLGYYRRARDLHRAAQIICTEHDSAFPVTPDVLSTLPGLGRYTVNAILSQAFDQRLPILEANSTRVLCRLFAVRADPKMGAIKRLLWEFAAKLLPVRRVGDFNQALMELGALICTAQAPKCSLCPIARHCRARLTKTHEQIPYRAAKTASSAQTEVAVVVRKKGKVLLVQRPTTGRWAHLWEFPHTSLLPGEKIHIAAERLLEELGIHATMGDEIVRIKHTVTRFRITLLCFQAHYRRGKNRSGFYVQAKWLDPDRITELALSSPQRRLALTVTTANVLKENV